MSYPKRLTADLPTYNRSQPQKKSFLRRIFPILLIVGAGVLGFLVPSMQRSKSTAFNNPSTQQQKQNQPAAPEPVYETKNFAVVKSNDLGYLNVRADASTASAKLGQLKIGDKVEVLAAKGTWVQIKLKPAMSGKDAGWVAADYVDQVSEKIRVN